MHATTQSHYRILSLCALAAVLAFSAPCASAQLFLQTNLVTDDQAANAAQITDPDLLNPWGISHSSSSPFWVSDNHAGVSTIYSVNPTTNVTAKVAFTVTIPPPGSGNPTGQAFNTASASGAFNGDVFLFVSEDGTISGWRFALGATAEVLQ